MSKKQEKAGQGMEIRLTPEARLFLEQQGIREVTIESFTVAGCCAPHLPPVVRLGAPRDPEGFLCVQQDGWRIYVDTLLEPPAHLTLGLQRFLRGGSELAVVDWPEWPAPPGSAPGDAGPPGEHPRGAGSSAGGVHPA